MNESTLILNAFENHLRAGLVQHTTQTNPVVEQNKNIKWSESPQNQFGRKGNVYGGIAYLYAMPVRTCKHCNMYCVGLHVCACMYARRNLLETCIAYWHSVHLRNTGMREV